MVTDVKLYRKRFIPQEITLLKDDTVLKWNDDVIVTSWQTLKPRADFATGMSCYFLKEGYKVSRMRNKDGELVYHYCDIINTVYNQQENAYIFEDLLVDVIIRNSGYVEVLDLEEIPEAMEQGLIDSDIVKKALRRLDSLLGAIYAGKLPELTNYMDEAEYEKKGDVSA